MPQLRKQPFVRQRPPLGLKPDDEVFHCTITNEIFADYEKFFERIILCNSMVWNCSITGRTGLTFQEALDCEAKARKKLSSFPEYLQKPILYLASITHKSRLNDLNDDVFTFAKDHFFINEVVDVAIGDEKKYCRIIKVVAPKTGSSDTDSDVICLDDDDDEEKEEKKESSNKTGLPNAEDYQYVVQEIKKTTIFMVGPAQISRKKGLYTREKSKLYLKQYCDASGDGIWKVKDRLRKKYLTDLHWEQLFDGPLPKFEVQKAKKKPSSTPGTSKASSCIDLTGEDELIREAKKQKKMKKMLQKEAKKKSKKAMEAVQKEEAKLVEVKESILSVLSSPSTAKEIDISELDSPSCEQLAKFVKSLTERNDEGSGELNEEDPLKDLKIIPKIKCPPKPKSKTAPSKIFKKDQIIVEKALRLGKKLAPVIPPATNEAPGTDLNPCSTCSGPQVLSCDLCNFQPCILTNRANESNNQDSSKTNRRSSIQEASVCNKEDVMPWDQLNKGTPTTAAAGSKGKCFCHQSGAVSPYNHRGTLDEATGSKKIPTSSQFKESGISTGSLGREHDQPLSPEHHPIPFASLGSEMPPPPCCQPKVLVPTSKDNPIIVSPEPSASIKSTSSSQEQAIRALSPTSQYLVKFVLDQSQEEIQKLREKLKEHQHKEKEKLAQVLREQKHQEKQDRHMLELEHRKAKREMELRERLEAEEIARAAKLGKQLAPVLCLDSEEASSQASSQNSTLPQASLKLSPTTRQLAERIKNLSPEELKKLKDELKEKKRLEKEKLKEEMRKIMNEEKMKKKEEKLKERVKKLEEKRQQEEHLKIWSRPRDDMECDDLKPLPKPQPVSVRIPSELFGSAVAVLEFIQCIEPLFDLEQGFPNGIDLGSLCESLQSTEPESLYTELVRFLLTAIFSLQDEEEAEEKEVDEDQATRAKVEDGLKTDSSFKDLVEQATLAAQIPQQTFGTSLSKLHVDNFTLTEVLRLHFLSSGARCSDNNARFRYQQRGGFTSLDDAGLEFRRREVQLIKRLGERSLYDLSPGAKLRIVEALMQQVLTFVATRDMLEDNYDKLKQAKSDVRSLQSQKNHREREEATFWYRKRLEEKAKEKELEAQRKEQKKKEREERLRLEEQGLPVPSPGPEAKETADAPTSDKPDPSSSSPPSHEEEVRKSQRTKQKEEKQQKEQSLQDWPATETIEWDKLAAEERALFNEAESRKEAEIQDIVSKFQQGNAIYPIGRDRTFRRYWVFRTLPGLFVEDEEIFIPDDFLQPVSQLTPRKAEANGDEKSTSSDKENESFEQGNSSSGGGNVNGATPTTTTTRADGDTAAAGDDDKKDTESSVASESVQEQVANWSKVPWGFYSSTEEIDALIDGLNPRGHREGPLKQALQEQRDRIVAALDNVPVDVLCMGDSGETCGDGGGGVQAVKMKKRRGHMKGEQAEEFLELNLREMLLDIEERIFVGGLGSLKVDNREKWRSALEEGAYYQGDTELTWSGQEEGVGATPVKSNGNLPNGHEAMETEEEEGGSSPVVRDLAKALLQVKQMVEPRYKKPPLGEDGKTRERKQREALELAFQGLTPRKIRSKVWDKKPKKKRTEDDSSDEDDDDDDVESDAGPKKTIEEQWEESVMSSSSLAQIFLCLSVLENAVEWTKSALNARCRTCRRKGQEDKMLLCDGCDRGYHMFCLKPAVKHIPKSDWFCPGCKPKIAPKTPRKHRKSFVEESEEEQEEDEEAEEEEADSSDEDSDDSDSDDSDEEEEEETEDEDKTPPPAKIKFAPKKKQQQQQQKKKIVYEDDDEDDASSMGSRSNSRAGSRRGSRSNTPKRESKGGRQSLEKAVLEKAMLAKGKKAAAPSKAPPTKKSRHSIETATPSAPSKSSSRPSRRSLPASQPTARQSTKRKAEEQPDEAPSSKKAATASSRRTSDVMKTGEEFLSEMMEKAEAWPFLTPVSKRDAPDYFDIVKTPMDLGTVRSKVKKYEYLNVGDLLRDIRLTFTNCLQYNMPQTAEFKAGQKLQRFFDKRVKELQLESHLKSPTKASSKSPSKSSPSKSSPSASSSRPSSSSRRSGRRT